MAYSKLEEMRLMDAERRRECKERLIAEQRDNLSQQVLQLSRNNSTIEHAVHKFDDAESRTNNTSKHLVQHQTASHEAALFRLELELDDS